MRHPNEDHDYIPTTACRIKSLARDINGFVNRLLSPYQLNASQAEFLAYLLFGLKSPSKIAELMAIDPSNLSRMTRQFEQRGWVTRHVDEDNRTRIELALTPEGHKVAMRIDPHAAIVQDTLNARLSPQEIEQLYALLDKVGAGLEAGADRTMPAEDDQEPR